MKLNVLKPRQALNKAFLKVKPQRPDIERFKANLIQLIDRSNDHESEEFHKNLVSDFLKKTWYDPQHFINTKGRNDLVIHTGADAKTAVGVVIEAKKPGNKTEMPTQERLNSKAFQELVLYYLRERITHHNLEVKQLVITNIYEWFIFDAVDFDRLFAQNKQLVSQFNDFEAGRLAEVKTDFFYRQIAEPFIAAIKTDIGFTQFDIRQYEKPLRNNEKADDNKLIALFKLLSPEHLLKLPFSNDSNSLDKRFYAELLHIIGLTETKEGGKKLIGRSSEGQRHTGSLLEDAIIQLDSLDKLGRISKPGQFGDTTTERLFNVALELSITWINRILFLKLLEAQLISYHKGDKSYAFLSLEKIRNYDDLNSLFFQVLARKWEERNADVKQAFEKVPYLNSSLFEPTELEQVTLFISNLRDDKQLPILPQTVLKDRQGKKLSGQLGTLDYLFRFLDAYDFSSEGSEEIQEDNKTLINASVLGLIFEKINGYKDGSFFTPGFITMYMCRETIRKAVLQKFNEAKQWDCKTIDDLEDKIEDRKEANAIINSVKICDPAVGSGHFLVSALNEMIAVKSDLRILQDSAGKRLKNYQVEVVNDELIVTDEDGELFEYHPASPESQRIQETLFHEKQTIIEHCLFGVDINPNSVKICRLRLWIELLKNAYYKKPGELETLPNIDINIKCGNSLVSRFALDADLSQALKKSKWTIDSYRLAVDTYRNADSKEQKREMERMIEAIKSDFSGEIEKPFIKKISEARGKADSLATEILNLTSFGEKAGKELLAKHKKAAETFDKLAAERDEIKANKIYENAFEWRFEFPEVLNDDGEFVGFDVVIGNPPYLTGNSFRELHTYFISSYITAEYQMDLYSFFIEKAANLLRSLGIISLITPNSWLKNLRMLKVRKFILENFKLDSLNPNISKAFAEAQVDTLIFSASKIADKKALVKIFEFKTSHIESLKLEIPQQRFLANHDFVLDVEVDNNTSSFLKKIRKSSFLLEEMFDITRGVNPYDKYRGQSADIISSKAYHSDHQKDNTFVPELRGKHVSSFYYKWDGKHYISYGPWLAAPRDIKYFRGPRLLFREIISERFICTVIEDDFIIDRSLYIALPRAEKIDVWFAAGILCSKLLVWIFRHEKNEFDELFPKIRLEEFKKLPYPKSKVDEEISDVAKEIFRCKKESIEQYELFEKLDQLVYKLYELTEEEVAIVESN